MYFVIARKNGTVKEKEIIDYIAGQFDSYTEASIFRKAYNEYYGSEAKIISSYKLLNLLNIVE